jgi:hypothetical protein
MPKTGPKATSNGLCRPTANRQPTPAENRRINFKSELHRRDRMILNPSETRFTAENVEEHLLGKFEINLEVEY